MKKAKKVSIKNDVFSFGMLMYEVYTEQIPFKDYTLNDKMPLEDAIQLSASFRPSCSGIFPENHLWYESLMKKVCQSYVCLYCSAGHTCQMTVLS